MRDCEAIMIPSVLVAYDGSPASVHGFDLAVDICRRFESQLYVLTVVDVPEFHDEVETETVMERAYRERSESQATLRRRAESGKIRAEFHIAVGRTAVRIVEFATQREIGLVVLGHASRGFADRYLPGSVAHAVISRAQSSVLVVR